MIWTRHLSAHQKYCQKLINVSFIFSVKCPYPDLVQRMKVMSLPVTVQWSIVLPVCPTVTSDPSVIVTVGLTGAAIE